MLQQPFSAAAVAATVAAIVATTVVTTVELFIQHTTGQAHAGDRSSPPNHVFFP